MNRVSSIAAFVLLAALAVAPAFGQVALLPAPAPVPLLPAPVVNTAPVVKEWTLAVFLNADNDLDPFGVEDQEEMAKIGSNQWLNMVTLIDRENGPACYNLIEKGKVTKLKDAGELDMGNYHQFVDFAKWVKANYPAKKYIFTIWNHGFGWKNAGKKVMRGVSFDGSSGNLITTGQLAVALKEVKAVLGHNIDILNFDACLMQMAEILYACKDTVDYVVGSEETEPGKGAPYDDVFAKLTAASTADSFSKAWVKAFVGSYTGGSQGNEDCTQSAIKCSELPKLFDAINGFSKAVIAGKYSTEFKIALSKVQRYSYPENIDLVHLATLIKGLIKEPGVQTACDKVLVAGKSVVAANQSSGYSMKNSQGVAIYLPFDFTLEGGYKDLEFAKVTTWDDMIIDLGKKSMAARLIATVEQGDLSALRRLASNAGQYPPDVVRFIVQELNFRLHSEAGLPAGVVEEATKLIEQLNATLL